LIRVDRVDASTPPTVAVSSRGYYVEAAAARLGGEYRGVTLVVIPRAEPQPRGRVEYCSGDGGCARGWVEPRGDGIIEAVVESTRGHASLSLCVEPPGYEGFLQLCRNLASAGAGSRASSIVDVSVGPVVLLLYPGADVVDGLRRVLGADGGVAGCGGGLWSLVLRSGGLRVASSSVCRGRVIGVGAR